MIPLQCTKNTLTYSYYYWAYCFLTFLPSDSDKNTEANLKMHNSNLQMAIITEIEYWFFSEESNSPKKKNFHSWMDML